ncbi:MAG: TRAP transporter substrate-binding protein [Deltaproteobacteria bacterium]|nr:TRAP transporter substrate-binding protein [Deltaproteobacteria bacterium]
MIINKLQLQGLAAGVTLFVLFCGNVDAATLRVRVAHTESLTHAVNVALLVFKYKVETLTNQIIEVEVLPEGRMGDDASLLEQVLLGEIQLSVIPIRLTLSMVPQAALAEMPFFFDNPKSGLGALNGDYSDALFPLFEEKGLVPLAWVHYGSLAVIDADKPLHDPEDFNGLRINGPEDPLFYDSMRALGAVPSSLSGEPLTGAVENGDVQALQIPLALVLEANQEKINRFVTASFQSMDMGLLVANAAFWQSLVPKFRAILREASDDFEAVNRGYQVQQEVDLLRKAAARGLSVEVMDENQRALFRQKMTPLYENWRHLLGPKWFDTFSNALAEKDIY